MKIRFQADADLNQIILLATVRREPSIDFQTAEAAGLAHRRDRCVGHGGPRGADVGHTRSENHAPALR